MTRQAHQLAPSWEWLERHPHPAAHLLLARAGLSRPWLAPAETCRAELVADVAVARAIAEQRADGSWGEPGERTRRILSTLWVVKALVEAGLDRQSAFLGRALAFLETTATTRGGVFSTTGEDHGVLPCYVSLAARLFHDAGCGEVAAHQLEWLTRYQQVRVAGVPRRAAAVWGHQLETRYGGCFSSTSCVIGVARAAAAWAVGPTPAARQARVAAREALLERSLAYARSGAPLALPSPGKRAHGWMGPAGPSDWHLDLIDVLDAAAPTVPGQDPRARRAIEELLALRRPDGSWSRGWHVTPRLLRGFGASRRGEGNPLATARAVVALSRWGG